MKFRITNTTVKAPRLDQNGKDLRTAVEKVGHSVQFRTNLDTPTPRPQTLRQGQSTLVDNIDPGLLNLQRGGFVKIEKIKDISAALKEHSLQQKTKKSEKVKAAGEARSSAEKKARAVEMGQDTHEQRGGSEKEDAVNPDGNPNFLAQAGKIRKGRKRKGGQEVKDVQQSAGSVGN